MTTVLARLWEVSLWGSLLTGIILLVKRLAGGRLPAAFHYGIWGVLLLRLLLPFPLYCRQAVDARRSEQPPQVSQSAQPPQALAGSPAAEGNAADGHAAETKNAPGGKAYLPGLLGAGYVLGLTVYAAVLSASLLRHRRELLPSQLPEDLPEPLAAIFREERERLHAPRRTRLRLAFSGSPYASGVFRPCVTLPLSVTADFDAGSLRAILRHELEHIRGGDAFFRAVLVVLQGIYWFNPILWYACACVRRDCEYACDARAVRRSTPAERVAYGRALLQVAGQDTFEANALYSTFGIRPMRDRIERILGYHPARRGAWLAAAVLVLACLAAGAAVGAYF